MTCVGPLATTVADLALLLAVISGPDDVDPYAVPVPLADWRGVRAGDLRVAVLHRDGVVEPTAGTVEAVTEAAARLRAAGAQVVDLPPLDTSEATALFFAATGAAGGADLLALVEGADGHHAPQFQRFLDAMTVRRPGAADWFALQERLHAFRGRVRRAMAACDVLLTPVVAGPAPRHGRPPGTVPAVEYDRYEAFNFTHTVSVAGLPAASVPVGSEDGLPIGVQVVGNAWREDVVLAAAAVLEGSGQSGGTRPAHGRASSS